ncbi:MAG: hypothetical protein RIS83_182, partial [Pseudomonadota bacterium]
DQCGGHFAGLARELLRILPDRDGMQINDAENAFRRILHRHPIANGAEVIAKGWNTGRLNAGKDARHCFMNR